MDNLKELGVEYSAFDDMEAVSNDNNTVIFYNTKDLARFWGCSVDTAREIMNRSDFPLIKVGKNYKVSKKAFEAWTMERRV